MDGVPRAWGLIALPIPGSTTRGSQELLDLIGCEVLAGAGLCILAPPRRGDFPIYGGWFEVSAEWQVDDLTHREFLDFLVFDYFGKVLSLPRSLRLMRRDQQSKRQLSETFQTRFKT